MSRVVNMVGEKQKASATYDMDNYADTYWQDLSEAESSVVISSPRLNTQKVNRIIAEMSKRQELGLKVTIVTWHPDAYKFGRDDVRMELMEKLRKAGFEIRLAEETCEHFAVIDKEIVWYGRSKKQLKRMTEAVKDAWILSQAKILPDFKREDFYKSICGTKKVISMPERSEITGFCEKVRNGDVVVEYETHYVEFDDYGHFHDDWEHEYYDPDHAMSFISSVIRGCHDLVVLEEFETAYEILDEVLGLGFTI